MKTTIINFKPILLVSICFLLVLFKNNAYSQSKLDCSKASTQAEINACAQSKYISADKELNSIYKKVIGKLDAQQKLVLVQSQRKWISFRDEYCKIYALIYAGGSMSPSAILKCKTEATMSRIVELQSLFDQLDL